MYKIKEISILFIMLLTMVHTSSFGQISKLDRMMSRECKPVDFSELKTFTKKELIERFCESKFLWEINSDSASERLQTILNMEKIATKQRSLGLLSSANETDLSVSDMKKKSALDQNHKIACSTEVDRIARILKSKAINKPTCTE